MIWHFVDKVINVLQMKPWSSWGIFPSDFGTH